MVLLVAVAKTHSEKQVLDAVTKQSKQGNKADRLTWCAGLQGSQGCLICFRPRACIIKHITSVIYAFRNKLECLSLNTRQS
jgi:hypothetical protein